MTDLFAALPMYDWPEARAETDSQWALIRSRLRAAGLDAPQALVRRNAEMPAVPGGIRDTAGRVIAPDPATLPPDDLDLATLWRHPDLLFSQTCWGPLETTGLDPLVTVVGQPDYSDVEGWEGTHYSSAVVMRKPGGHGAVSERSSSVSRNGLSEASLPLTLLRNTRLAYNDPHSMSGLLALTRDLQAAGESLALFSDRVETGGHRLSIHAVAEGRADVCTIDCRSWALAKRFEPTAARLRVVGWTGLRKGLPYITGQPDLAAAIAEALRLR